MDKDFAEFHKAFERLSYQYGKDTIKTFEEFLDYALIGNNHEVKADLSRFKEKEIELFHQLYEQWILLLKKKQVHQGAWFDAFGLYFETHSSEWGRKKKGQFFTPVNLCDMMVLMMNPSGEGQRVYDPACGSGRMILAAHAHNPNNYHYACDIDLTCCKMTVLNMMIHRIRGEVVWKNALSNLEYRKGWAINPYLNKYNGLPHIMDLPKEQSFIFHEGQCREKEREQAEHDYKQQLLSIDFLDIQDDKKISFNDTKEKTSFDFF